MWKVIIADDERAICRLIEALVDWGSLDMEVAGVAGNGLEALQMVRDLSPHLLITDIRMPGCDGLELIRQARELQPDIEIVIISGYAHFEYAQTAIAYGVGNYILKPVNREELAKTLQKIALRLEERGRREAARDSRQRPAGPADPQRLRQYFIRDVLDGKRAFTAGELAGCQFHTEGRAMQPFLVKLDLDGEELAGPALAIIRQKTEELFQAAVLPCCDEGALYFRDMAGCGLLLYPPEGRDRDRARRALRELLKRLEASKTLFGKVSFSIGLGRPVQRPEELADAMDGARLAAQERLIEGCGRMLEEVPPASGLPRRAILSGYAKALDHAVEILDGEALVQAGERMWQAALGEPNVRGRELAELISDAGRIVALHTGGGEEALRDFELRCGRCGRAELLFRELERFQDRALLELKARRESEAARPIRAAKRYVQENYGRNITLEDVCEVVGFTPNYFSALFKKETGEGFSKYLTRVRIDRAKELLRETDLPVAEICEAVGYSDRKHFTQTFHKTTGVTPAEFRRLYG